MLQLMGELTTYKCKIVERFKEIAQKYEKEQSERSEREESNRAASAGDLTSKLDRLIAQDMNEYEIKKAKGLTTSKEDCKMKLIKEYYDAVDKKNEEIMQTENANSSINDMSEHTYSDDDEELTNYAEVSIPSPILALKKVIKRIQPTNLTVSAGTAVSSAVTTVSSAVTAVSSQKIAEIKYNQQNNSINDNRKSAEVQAQEIVIKQSGKQRLSNDLPLPIRSMWTEKHEHMKIPRWLEKIMKHPMEDYLHAYINEAIECLVEGVLVYLPAITPQVIKGEKARLASAQDGDCFPSEIIRLVQDQYLRLRFKIGESTIIDQFEFPHSKGLFMVRSASIPELELFYTLVSV